MLGRIDISCRRPKIPYTVSIVMWGGNYLPLCWHVSMCLYFPASFVGLSRLLLDVVEVVCWQLFGGLLYGCVAVALSCARARAIKSFLLLRSRPLRRILRSVGWILGSTVGLSTSNVAFSGSAEQEECLHRVTDSVPTGGTIIGE